MLSHTRQPEIFQTSERKSNLYDIVKKDELNEISELKKPKESEEINAWPQLHIHADIVEEYINRLD